MTELPEDNKLFKQDGLVRYPNYEFWWNWIESLNFDSEKAEAIWTELLFRWTRFLSSDLGDAFQKIEDKEFIFLSSMANRRLRLLLEFARRAKNFIKTNLVTEFDDGSPILILVFEDHELYANYLAPIYEIGAAEVPPSNGVYLSGHTYPHIVLLADGDLSPCETVLSHELAHFYLGAYNLPRWLDEGLAKLIEKEVTGNTSFSLSTFESKELEAFWKPEILPIFWSGEIFERGDGTEKFGYYLAEIIVRSLVAQGKDKLQQLLQTAKLEEGGIQAANDIFDVDLNEFVLAILDQR